MSEDLSLKRIYQTCTEINTKVLPPKENILPKGIIVTRFEEFLDGVFLDIELVGGYKEMNHVSCPVCGHQNIRERGRKKRTVKDIPYLGRQISLELNMTEYQCMGRCGRKSFVPELKGFLEIGSKMTVRLKEFIILLAAASSNEAASRILEYMSTDISGDTVDRVLKDYGMRSDQSSVWNAAKELHKATPRRYTENQIEDLAQNLAYYMTPEILSLDAEIRLEAMKELFEIVFVKKKKSPGCSSTPVATPVSRWEFSWKNEA